MKNYKIFVITRYVHATPTIKTDVIEFEELLDADAAVTQINTNIVTGISITAIKLY